MKMLLVGIAGGCMGAVVLQVVLGNWPYRRFGHVGSAIFGFAAGVAGAWVLLHLLRFV